MSPRVIVVDAYDSFVHILVSYLESLGCRVSLFRKDNPGLMNAIYRQTGDMILLGPGPGHPAESGYSNLLDINAGRLPVLGVCLGHQAIGLHYGCKVTYAQNLMHGKISQISHDGSGCFKDFPREKLSVMRYHSIILADEDVPKSIQITARSHGDDYVMGIRHKTLKIEGIQFHPESIGTEGGMRMLQNFIENNIYGVTKDD